MQLDQQVQIRYPLLRKPTVCETPGRLTRSAPHSQCVFGREFQGRLHGISILLSGRCMEPYDTNQYSISLFGGQGEVGGGDIYL